MIEEKNFDSTRFAYYLRDLRTRRGLSITDLAIKAGVSQSEITRLEIGKRSNIRISTVMKLAKALDVDAIDLIRAIDYSIESEEKPIELLELLRTSLVSINNIVLKPSQVKKLIKLIELLFEFGEDKKNDEAAVLPEPNNVNYPSSAL